MAKKQAKKKVAKKAPAGKTAAKKKSTRTKAAAKKTTRAKKAAPKRKVAKKPAKKVARKKKAPARAARTTVKKKTVARKTRKKTGKRASTLGRPRVPADAQLDIVFRKDYKAREVFEFLGVTTVRELEKFGPDEIIRLLTGPMVQTVGRIRKAMALCNRSLAGDLEFALEFKEKAMASSESSKS